VVSCSVGERSRRGSVYIPFSIFRHVGDYVSGYLSNYLFLGRSTVAGRVVLSDSGR